MLALAADLALVMGLNFSGRLADIVWAKGVRRKHVEFARWNASSRVEVDHDDNGGRVIVIDADANTYIMNADISRWQGSGWQNNLMSAPPAVVNALRPHGDYAIIGPGGGVDVLRPCSIGAGWETGSPAWNHFMLGTPFQYRLFMRTRQQMPINMSCGA